tara:strand:- start:227 stop:517 length:291 start_codon:yes stop_codon:yes gene_type:complete
MANKIVKYQLDNGAVPTWIADGGYYPDANKVMIGATVDGSTETGEGELTSQENVESYLNTYTSTWTQSAYNPMNESETEPFDQAQAATKIWAKKID